MRCIVVTPEKTVLETEATFVALPLYDGELGISEKHTPLIGRVGAGQLRAEKNSSSEKKSVSYYVEGGFVEVLNDTVTLLTGRAIPIDQLNADTASKQLAEVLKRKATTEDTLNARERESQYLRNLIHLAKRV